MKSSYYINQWATKMNRSIDGILNEAIQVKEGFGDDDDMEERSDRLDQLSDLAKAKFNFPGYFGKNTAAAISYLLISIQMTKSTDKIISYLRRYAKTSKDGSLIPELIDYIVRYLGSVTTLPKNNGTSLD